MRHHKTLDTPGLPDRPIGTRLDVDALRDLRDRQDQERTAAGARWHDNGLVFTTRYGTALSPDNVRRDVRTAISSAPGADAGEWIPRELRHSFVSLLSHSGIPLEEIRRWVMSTTTCVSTVSHVLARLADQAKLTAGVPGLACRLPRLAGSRFSKPVSRSGTLAAVGTEPSYRRGERSHGNLGVIGQNAKLGNSRPALEVLGAGRG